jgi:enoyl-CoA hydratase
MATASTADMRARDQFKQWERIKRVTKPIVAAVSGFALGGGCELMMHCDIIVCSETAKIGQPEINIGVMPGAGGTQRLTRAIGKALAMDVVLSGRFLTATQAMEHGLVSRIVPREHWYTEALKVAQKLATMPPVALRNAKAAVLLAHEAHLSDGLIQERRLFTDLFDTEDQKEGMSAFMEKRRPVFKGR